MSKRIKVEGYKGIFYRTTKRQGGKGEERIYYVVYKKDNTVHEEKVGGQYKNGITPAKANIHRSLLIEGKVKSRKQIREEEKAKKKCDDTRWTIDKIWAKYKKDKLIKGLRIDEYRFDKYLKPAYGEKEPREIIPLDIDRLRIMLSKKNGLKPASVYNILELLRRIVRYAAKKRLCEGFDFVIEMPKVENEKTEDLTPNELQSLLKAIEKDTHSQAGPIMLMALYTGMRRGELFRLKWKEIDLDRGFIHIRNPKGGIDQIIPLNDGARKVLEGIYHGESEYVFPGRGGRQRTDIHHQVNRIRDNAGLPKDFRALHGLRHVYASMLASSGKVDMYTLQKLLTHKSPQMTQRYAHLRDETLKKASDLAGDIISGAMDRKSSEKVANLRRKDNEEK
jgi:integrase